MKKKFLIISASISLLLACFPFTLCAEEDPQSDLGVSAPPAYYELDNYFYENYERLPYIESDGTQYINTGISASSELYVNLSASNLSVSETNAYLYGVTSSGNSYGVYTRSNYNGVLFVFLNSYSYVDIILNPSNIYNITFDRNNISVNGISQTIDDNDFSNLGNIYIFGRGGNSLSPSSYRLYNFSIYDYSADSGNGAYVRYYYPARSKSGNVIGLYDAVSKTFVSSASSYEFTNPSGNIAEAGIISNIGIFIYNGLGWISDILAYAITEPVILLFMAIGLAGASIRWARRLVHF